MANLGEFEIVIRNESTLRKFEEVARCLADILDSQPWNTDLSEATRLLMEAASELEVVNRHG